MLVRVLVPHALRQRTAPGRRGWRWPSPSMTMTSAKALEHSRRRQTLITGWLLIVLAVFVGGGVRLAGGGRRNVSADAARRLHRGAQPGGSVDALCLRRRRAAGVSSVCASSCPARPAGPGWRSASACSWRSPPSSPGRPPASPSRWSACCRQPWCAPCRSRSAASPACCASAWRWSTSPSKACCSPAHSPAPWSDRCSAGSSARWRQSSSAACSDCCWRCWS